MNEEIIKEESAETVPEKVEAETSNITNMLDDADAESFTAESINLKQMGTQCTPIADMKMPYLKI
jgi:hypothetical protein